VVDKPCRGLRKDAEFSDLPYENQEPD